ncbi:hypothetical protein Tco_0758042 [Tanacetum coccineum]
MGQSIQMMHMLSSKPDSFYHAEQKMALGYQNSFYLKQAQQKQQSLYNGKVLLEKHDPPAVYDSEETLQLAQEQAVIFVRDFKSLAKEADESLAKHKSLAYEIEHLLSVRILCRLCKNLYDKAYKDMHQKIKRLQAQLGDLKGKNKDTLCISDTLAPLSQKLEDENVIPKVGESNALLKPVTSNSAPSTRESKVVKNDNVIASGMFRINPFNTSKNDRVPSAYKSSCIKNKDVEVEEKHMNLLLSKNQKHMSSECNNIKLAIRNDKSEVVCAMCRSNLFMVRRLGMFKAHDRKSEASYKFRLEVSRNCLLWK